MWHTLLVALYIISNLRFVARRYMAAHTPIITIYIHSRFHINPHLICHESQSQDMYLLWCVYLHLEVYLLLYIQKTYVQCGEFTPLCRAIIMHNVMCIYNLLYIYSRVWSCYFCSGEPDHDGPHSNPIPNVSIYIYIQHHSTSSHIWWYRGTSSLIRHTYGVHSSKGTYTRSSYMMSMCIHQIRCYIYTRSLASAADSRRKTTQLCFASTAR